MDFTSNAAPANGKESGALVIFTRIEGLLIAPTHLASSAQLSPLRFLASHGVPMVLVSAWDGAEIRRIQRECGLSQPFICEEGGALHVPRRWLGESRFVNRPGQEDEWEIFRLSPPSISAAFELVTAMFVARGYDPLLTVGIGCDLADYALLSAVDVPILVPPENGRQPELLHSLPGAYVTLATGAAGWSEAVLGTAH